MRILSSVVSIVLLATTSPLDISKQSKNIIQVNGQKINAIGALNITSPPSGTGGCGIVWAVTPDTVNNKTDISASVNSACSLSISTNQSGIPTYCQSNNGTSGYTCGLSNALQKYTKGMFVLFNPDVNNINGAASLNIDGLSVQAIKQSDGTTDPDPNTIVGQRYYWLFFDGTVFRMQ